MIVEVTGAAFENKGAQLMLAAVRDQVADWDSVEALAVNFRVGSKRQRDGAGYRSVLHLDSETRGWANPVVARTASLAPQRVLDATGLVRPADVGAVFDASGFQFSDQWGLVPAATRARQYGRWRAAGSRIVVLPQAFGPFEDPEVRSATRDALEHSDLVFARDDESFAHLESLKLRAPHVSVAPDFTNLVQPRPQPRPPGTVAIIPNNRMVDMTSRVEADSYVDFLHTVARAVVDNDHPVIVVVHETQDADLAASLAASVDANVPVIQLADPVEIKAVLGGTSLVVSSRYHGLVSAMSQGVPAIGTSWSHKYAALFSDYDCADALWDVGAASEVANRITEWLQPGVLDARSAALRQRGDGLKAQAQAMWDQVQACVVRHGD